MPDTTENERRPSRSVMFPQWLPAYRTDDLRLVDWPRFAQAGIRLIAVDLDNTLAVHGSDKPDRYAREAVAVMQRAGLAVCLYSNAALNRDQRFAEALGIDAVPGVSKPDPAALSAELKRRGLQAKEVLVAGDQLFTDVWSANRLGVRALLVSRRDRHELVTIRLKRAGEAIVTWLDRKGHAGVPAAPAVSVYMPRQMP